jgi:hypothetical protein
MIYVTTPKGEDRCAYENRRAGCSAELVEDDTTIPSDVRDQCLDTYETEFGTSEWILAERGGMYRLINL